jgi:hypothetical protein
MVADLLPFESDARHQFLERAKASQTRVRMTETMTKWPGSFVEVIERTTDEKPEQGLETESIARLASISMAITQR